MATTTDDEDETASGRQSLDRVDVWLKKVGLGYAAANFQMAGIVSPRSLADLELGFYEALGVKKSEDRKKLFYLVERVKVALESDDGDEGADEEGEDKSERYSTSTAGTGTGDENEESIGGEYDSLSLLRDEVSSQGSAPSPPPVMDDEEEDEERSGTAATERISLVALIESDPPLSHALDLEKLRRPISGIANVVIQTAGTADKKDRSLRKCLHPNSRTDLEVGMSVDTNDRMDTISPVSMASPLSRFEGLATGTAFPTIAVADTKKVSTKETSNVKQIDKRARKKQKERDMIRHALASKMSDISRENGGKYQSDFDDVDDYLMSDGGSAVGDREGGSANGDRDFKRDGINPLTKGAISSGGSSSHRTLKKNNLAGTRRFSHGVIPAPSSIYSDCDDNSVGSNASELSSSSRRSLGSVNSFKSKNDRSKRLTSRLSSAGVASLSGITAGSADVGQTKYSMPKMSEPSVKSTAKSSISKNDRTRRRSSRLSSAGVTSLSGTTAALVDVGRNKISSSKMSGTSVKATAIPTRTGKTRLSVIPSSSIAPISPLAALSSSQLEESMYSQHSTSNAKPSALLSSRKKPAKGSKLSRPGTADSSRSRRSSTSPTCRRIDMVSSFESISTQKSTASTSSTCSIGGPCSRVGRANVGGVLSSQRSARSSSQSSLDKTQQSSLLNNSSNSLSDSGRSTTSTNCRQYQPNSPSRGIPDRSASPNPRGKTAPGRSISPGRNCHNSSRSPLGNIQGRTIRTTSPYAKRNDRSISPLPRSHGRSVSPMRSTSTTRSPNRSKSPNNSDVFVHGLPEDNSWGTQIAQLRGACNESHSAYMNGREAYLEDDEYDMRIRVIVRKRPMSKREASEAGEVDVIHPLDCDDFGRILVYQPKRKLDLTKEVETSYFAFDNVFDVNANNVEIYSRAVRSLIPGVFHGKWASVFAYGQTGSGKTFTMMGSNMTGMKAGNQKSNISESNFGLYFLAAQDVFALANEPENKGVSVGVSLFEIYGGKLLDLLNNRNAVRCLEDHKGSVCFPGLTEHPASCAEKVMDIINAGSLNRSTGTTSANADSSRSHAVLQLSLRKSIDKKRSKEYGRLTFIDLAGSERGADTSLASRTTRLEGAEINTSLLALKEVIRALATGDSMKRIPFRSSKLTQVLKESFIGKKSRTVMVACVAPNMKNCDHTLNTLRYTDRVKDRDSKTGKLTATVAANSKIKRDYDYSAKARLPPRPLSAPTASFRIDRCNHSPERNDCRPPVPRQGDCLADPLADEGSIFEDYDSKGKDTVRKEYDSSDENDSLADVLSLSDSSLAEVFSSNDSSLAEVPSSKEGSSPVRPQLERAHIPPSPSHNIQPSRTQSPPPFRKDSTAAQSLIETHKCVMNSMLSMVKHEMTLVNSTDTDRENIDEYLTELDKLSNKQLSLISTLRDSLMEYYASRNPPVSHFEDSNCMSDPGTDLDDSYDDLRD